MDKSPLIGILAVEDFRNSNDLLSHKNEIKFIKTLGYPFFYQKSTKIQNLGKQV